LLARESERTRILGHVCQETRSPFVIRDRRGALIEPLASEREHAGALGPIESAST
jgi:hypothetical protein